MEAAVTVKRILAVSILVLGLCVKAEAQEVELDFKRRAALTEANRQMAKLYQEAERTIENARQIQERLPDLEKNAQRADKIAENSLKDMKRACTQEKIDKWRADHQAALAAWDTYRAVGESAVQEYNRAVKIIEKAHEFERKAIEILTAI